MNHENNCRVLLLGDGKAVLGIEFGSTAHQRRC